jgi:hypothetical protein
VEDLTIGASMEQICTSTVHRMKMASEQQVMSFVLWLFFVAA